VEGPVIRSEARLIEKLQIKKTSSPFSPPLTLHTTATEGTASLAACGGKGRKGGQGPIKKDASPDHISENKNHIP